MTLKEEKAMIIQEVPSEEAPISLLLEADPSESKIQTYLATSSCYAAIQSNEIVGIYVLKALNPTTMELMNIAVKPTW